MTELSGGKCSVCGHVSWPRPNYCPEGCGATIQPHTLANKAKVYVSTRVDVPHPVFGSSYRVGYADLESGPRVFGHFPSVEPVPIGSEVRVTVQEFDDPERESKTEAIVFQQTSERDLS